MTSRAPADVSELLTKWIETAHENAMAHRKEAIVLKRRYTQIGAPSVVLSAVVGTSIFAAIQEAAQSFALKSLLALLSMIAAALAALITFFSFQERAAIHRIASEEYDDMALRLEVPRTSLIAMAPEGWRNVLDGYSQTLEAIGRRAALPDSKEKFLKPSRRVSIDLTDAPSRGPFSEELHRVFFLAANKGRWSPVSDYD
jgi:hypothetical protein